MPGPNCLLSEFAMRDLRPGLELVRDPAHWLFAWNEDDPRCARGYGRRPRPPLLPGRGMDDGRLCQLCQLGTPSPAEC